MNMVEFIWNKFFTIAFYISCWSLSKPKPINGNWSYLYSKESKNIFEKDKTKWTLKNRYSTKKKPQNFSVFPELHFLENESWAKLPLSASVSGCFTQKKSICCRF